jgi:hypothetical protein
MQLVPITTDAVGSTPTQGEEYNINNYLAIFRTEKKLNATGLETRKGDGYGRII